jgi:Dolichyl-phosphate-mannose-protein mannosyltransferase
MKIIGWIIIFFLGVSVINTVAYRLKSAEKIAFAFPVGMGVNSIIFFTAELLHLSLKSINSFLSFEIFLVIVLSSLTIRKTKYRFSFNILINKLRFDKFPPLNPAWIFLTGVILFITYILICKSLFWPIALYDSITGYDFIAKAMAQEGTLNSSIFQKENPLYSIRSLYPPLVPINFGFAYLIGHASSQIVVLIFFISTLFSFYLFLRRKSTHLCAAFFTLLLIITPEFAAFSTISTTNIPCAFYTSFGILCLYIWTTEQNKNYFTIGTLFIVLAVWTRTEAIVFAAGGGLMLLFNRTGSDKIKLLLLLGVACFGSLALWQFYIKEILNISGTQLILHQLSWDPDKLLRMLHQIKLVTFSTQYFGLTILLFWAMIFINLKNLLTKQGHAILLASIFTCWTLYIVIFYFLNTDYRDYSMGGWIFSGYKRGLFSFLPLFLYYSATNKISGKLFNEYLNFTEPTQVILNFTNQHLHK